MKVKEAAELLAQMVADGHGDVELVGMEEIDGEFAIDYGRTLDIIEIPSTETGTECDLTVCAFMVPVEESGSGNLSVLN